MPMANGPSRLSKTVNELSACTNMNTDQQESNIVIMSNRTRLRLFCKIYKNTITFIIIPLILLPITFIGDNNAYLCFYAFLVTAAYWIFEVLHPAVISLIPIALSTIMNSLGYEIISFINIRHALFECFGMLMFIVAIENSQLHKRIAVRILMIFGCSHYRLSFLLFFTTMILSMWISNTLACGFFIPIVKATITELEKMGILEVYDTTEELTEGGSHNKNNRIQRPSDFTVFYFLGIAYSSSIGGMAAIVGSHTNQLFKAYSETLFPLGPKVEFPQFMLLTLPGVLVLETAVYLWMNFYFLGLFRIHNYSALHTGSTEEEAQFTKTLLKNQYQKLGKITDKEVTVVVVIFLCGLLHMTTSTYLCNHTRNYFISHIQVSAPTILCILILFILPSNLDFLKFCKKQYGQGLDPLPSSASKPCLDWRTVKNEIHWSVLLVTGGSCAMFEALKQSKMTDEFERFLRILSDRSAVLLVLVVVVFCKILTEFASNFCVAQNMLDHVTRVGERKTSVVASYMDNFMTIRSTPSGSQHPAMASLASRVNPHYVMLATILACSVPFHLTTGTPANTMVSSYFNIPLRTMIYAGIGPTIFAVLIIWFTVTVWSKAIWIDITAFPDWANTSSNMTMLL